MSAIRLSQHPKGYTEPARLNVVEYRALLGRTLPRCTACGGDLCVMPPELTPGRVVCGLCSREYAEVVDRLPYREPLTGEDARPKRGRPPGKRQADHSQCGPGSWCGTCRTIRARQRARAS